MTQLHISLRDRVVAETLTAGSSFVNWSQRSESPDKFNVRARWHHARVPAEAIQGWVEFKGDPDARRLPPYEMRAILRFNKHEMNEAHDHHGGRQVVAYALGTAVMVGISQDVDIFSTYHPDDEFYRVSMGIGRGTLRAVAGLWSSDQGLFVPDIAFTGTSVHSPDLPEGIYRL